MADEDPTRPGWWRASDGELYPPELHPEAASRTARLPQSAGPPPGPPPGAPPGPPGGYGSPPPGPGGYGAPPGPPPGAPPGAYGAPPGAWSPHPGAPKPSTPGLAIAALIIGVGALAFSFIPIIGLASIPFALAAVGLGIAGVSRANKGEGGKGMAVAGIGTGAAALLISIAWTILWAVVIDDASDEINSDPSDGVCNEERFLQDPDC